MYLEQYEKEYNKYKKKFSKFLPNPKDVMDEEFSYDYLVRYFSDDFTRIVASRFVYPGLEKIKSLPPHEVEIRLINHGYTILLYDKAKCGGWYVSDGAQYNPTQYYDIFTDASYANPLTSGQAKIGEDCFVIKNDNFAHPLRAFIRHYASLLALDTIAIVSDLRNELLPNAFNASDDTVAEAIKSWYQACLDGNFAVIISDMPEDVNLVSQGKTASIVMSHIDAYNEHLREFYNEIGVRYTRDKKERMIESEVGGDDQRLLVNSMAELRRRQQDWAEIKEFTTKYNEKHPEAEILDVTPQFAPEFAVVENALDNPETEKDEGSDEEEPQETESEEVKDDNVE